MQPGDVVGGRYRILREAGHGGMGTVYRGIDADTGAPVAIKVMRRSDLLDEAVSSGRFAREVELLASLADPRIVRYVAHGATADGRPYLVVEWIDGETLAERLDEEGLTVGEAVRILRDVAGGLAVAHARGIVHRDVKPDNLLFVGGDLTSVKIIDFGLARHGDEAFPITRAGTFVGTPGYVSPEQARGAMTLDARSDVFALGCILYECLTGHPPFQGRGLTAVRAKVLLYEPPPPASISSDVPAELSALTMRMLSKDPIDRPAAGDEVAAALAPFTALEGGPRHGGREQTGETAVVGPGERTDVDTQDTSDTREAGLLACVVIADADPDADRALLRAAIAPHGGRLEEVPGGTLLVTAPPTLMPSQQVLCAARCALALRPLVAGSIVLCGATAPARRESISIAIDEGVGALEADNARADTVPGRVRVERAFAAVLRDAGFEIDQDAGGATFVR